MTVVVAAEGVVVVEGAVASREVATAAAVAAAEVQEVEVMALRPTWSLGHCPHFRVPQ